MEGVLLGEVLGRGGDEGGVGVEVALLGEVLGREGDGRLRGWLYDRAD